MPVKQSWVFLRALHGYRIRIVKSCAWILTTLMPGDDCPCVLIHATFDYMNSYKIGLSVKEMEGLPCYWPPM